MNFWTLMLIIIYIINVFTIIVLLFFEKRNVSSTISWILVIAFLPIVGFILYLFFGSTDKLKVMSRKYSLRNIEIEYKNILDETKKQILIEHEDNFYKDVILFNTNNEGIYTTSNKIQMLTSAKDKYEAMFSDIESAKETIHVEYFIIKSRDKIGKKFIELLTKKAKEGVKVKVIYDRMGYYTTRFKDFKSITKNGGQVQMYLPSLIKTLFTANYRLHRKIVVIDNKIAYTGGINIGDDYLGLDKKIKPWRDTSIKIEGFAVSTLQLRFLYDWNYLLKQNNRLNKKLDPTEIIKMVTPEFKNNVGVQILSSGPDANSQNIRDTYVKMVSNAEKYVYIETPYFVPDDVLLNTIRIAVMSGVDVRIIIPGIPDKKFVYNITLAYIEEVLKFGAKVYLHEGFIHAKSFTSDEYITSIGTCNVDIRSFMLNYENTAIIYDKEIALENKEIFMEDIKHSKELKLDDMKKKGVIYRIKQALFRFIAPLV